MERDVVIVGAGIGGLALASALHQAGLSVTLVEKDNTAGGVIKTVKHQDFLLELGPNSSIERPEFSALAKSFGLEEQIVTPTAHAARRYLATKRTGRDGEFHLSPVPQRPLQMLTSPLLSPLGKARLLCEPLVRRSKQEDESVERFMNRRFGREFQTSIVSAMLGGIWAADTSRLSARSALARVWEMEVEHRSIIAAGLKRVTSKKSPGNKTKPSLMSFKNGMQSLPDAMAASLPAGAILLESEVTKLKLGRLGATLEVLQGGKDALTIDAKQVVLTTPSYVSGPLIADYAPRLAERITAIPYSPVGVIHVAYDKRDVEHALDGFGFLVPATDRYPLLGAIFSSSLFEGRAPKGKHLLTCFAGGASNPHLADVNNPQVVRRVVSEASRFIGAMREPQVLSQLYWSRAIPNYPVNHHRTVAELAAFSETYPQLHMLANWKEGISVADRVRTANQLAKQIINNSTPEQIPRQAIAQI